MSAKHSAIIGVCICAAVVAACIILRRKPEQVEEDKTPTSPEARDRALREEQLAVAERLAKAHPNNANAVYLMGLVHNEQGDAVKAVACWEQSLTLGRSDADVYDKLGHAALQKEAFEKAAAFFRKAIEKNPRNPEIRLRLAKALTHQGRMREAIEALEQGGRLPSEGYRMLGEAYQQLREYSRAKTYFETAIRIRSDFAEAYYGLATTCARMRERDAARQYMEKFKQLKEKNANVGRHWRKVFDPLQVTRESVAHTHTDVGRVYYAAGNAEEAETLWKRAASLDPKSSACRFQLGLHYQRSKRPQDALVLYEELATIEPQNAFIYFNLGNVHLALRDYAKAEAALKKAIELDPRNPGYKRTYDMLRKRR